MTRTLTDRDTDALIARHIAPHPSNPDLDEYWLSDPGVPVWAIIGAYKAEGGNADEVAAAYHLSSEQLAAALAYYQRHRSLIDNRLAQNQPALWRHSISMKMYPKPSLRSSPRVGIVQRLHGSKAAKAWPMMRNCGTRRSTVGPS
jgi:uncharacterized protein (DUF433 family)